MKKITLSFAFLFSLFLVQAQQVSKQTKKFGKEISADRISPSGFVRCVTDEYETFLQAKDPSRLNHDQLEAQIAPIIENYKNQRSETGGIIYIPVVVHVIHNGDAYGVDENITDEQVLSQITVMNQDFRRMAGTPGFNTNPVGADIQIQFVMAKADPNGNPTNGINRVNLCTASYAGADANATIANVEAIKPQTIWNPLLYMNMWSVKWDGSGLLGYAQFPATGTATANTDGVVSGHTFFGSRTIYPGGNYGAGTQYDKGRTMTHEVGHYLGLYHTFQGGCSGAGDSCADTPAVATANYDCPTGTDSCAGGGADMIENYMDYTDDSCMNVFTANQKTRIYSFMTTTYPRRNGLRTSTKDIAIPLFANDAEVKIENYCTATPNPCGGNTHKVLLYNRGTSNLTSATINYNVNGGASTPVNWIGNLAPNKYEIVTFTTTQSTGTLNVSIANANGGADQRAGNNTASKAFNFPATTPPTDYPYTNYTFNLIGDPWGDETSWQLENASGAILYSGGPYTFTGVAGTQVLENNLSMTLPAGGCYTFKLFDAFGDGMGGSGAGDEGSWSLTTNSGATTVSSGTGNFGSEVVQAFTNASLSNSSFNLESISIYPNPTSNILNVNIPSQLGSDTTYQIFNYLGQVIKSDKTSTNSFSINTSEFSNGVYFIKLNVEGASKTLRFIKN